MQNEVTKPEFCNALAQLASGVSIITTAFHGQMRGITATAVNSVTADPPTVLVCTNSSTGTSKMIADAGWFAVNFLAAGQRAVSDVFAGMGGLQGDDRFGFGDWETSGPNRLPLLTGALAQLECEVEKMVKSGTHDVYFGHVRSVKVSPGEPLIYHGGNYLPHAPFVDKNRETVGVRTMSG